MPYPPLKLKKNEERRLQAGHLWVFSNEVNTRETPLTGFTPGDIVTVTTASGKPLGNAYINPQSLICARLYSHNPRQDLDQDLLQTRIEQALQLRYKRYDQPFYRGVYSEGDLLPGLVVDRFDNALVVQTSTLGMDMRQAAIVAALDNVLQPDIIIINNNISTRTLEGLEQYINVAKGQPGDTLQVRENEATFTFPAVKGQKTGWFYDHRDNRRAMIRWTHQARVLDVFSYIGGWGIEAAMAGAQHVTAVETSASACNLLANNAEQNDVADKITIVNDDAFDTLNRLKENKEKFDLIVLDPPAFIKRKKDLKQGVAAYQRLNKLAMQLLNNNAMLISASCSYHFSRDQHLKTLRDCARQCGQQLQVVEEGHAGADHPRHPAIPETAYLSCFTVRLIRETAP